VTFLDTNPNIGSRYAAAPQLFYFAPDDEWYLVYQTGPPSYSTSKNPADPQGNDQKMNIDTGNLQMLYQGRDPSTDGMEYSQLPYRLALLTLTGGASC
jgi:hypothetical protein